MPYLDISFETITIVTADIKDFGCTCLLAMLLHTYITNPISDS